MLKNPGTESNHPQVPCITQEQFEQIKESFKLAEESRQWVSANRVQLLKQYPNQWVACCKGRVIAHNRDLRRLANQVLKKYPDQYGVACFEYLTEDDPPIVLVVISKPLLKENGS